MNCADVENAAHFSVQSPLENISVAELTVSYSDEMEVLDSMG